MSDRALLQADYGGFNPRFLGVSLLYDDPRRYNGAYAFLTGRPVPDQEPQEIDGLDAIVLRSVGDHEARHYHDFLLSPYSSAILRMRLMAVVNGLQALNQAKDIAGTVIPSPLAAWATLGPAERDRFEQEWREILGPATAAIDIPFVDEATMLESVRPEIRSLEGQPPAVQFELYLRAAVMAYTQIDRLTRGPIDTDEQFVRPAYIHEASALTAQAAAIYTAQGAEETGEFVSFLIDSHLPGPVMWRAHLQLASQLERIDTGTGELFAGLRRILSITVWAMLGNYARDGAGACPTARFMTLSARLMSEPTDPRWSAQIDDPEDLRRMWDFWDAQLGASAWEAAVHENLAAARRSLERFEQLEESWRGPGDIAVLTRSALERTIEQQQQLADAFLEDPTVLAVPERYVQADEALLPNPDLRIEYRGFGSLPNGLTGVRELTRELSDGSEVVTGIAAPGAGRHTRESALAALDEKLRLERMMEMCDLAFSRLSVPDHAAESARSAIQRVTGKRLLQLV